MPAPMYPTLAGIPTHQLFVALGVAVGAAVFLLFAGLASA